MPPNKEINGCVFALMLKPRLGGTSKFKAIAVLWMGTGVIGALGWVNIRSYRLRLPNC